MARKNTLTYEVATNQSMAATFTTNPTVINYLDNISYQINITTSNSTGTFKIQASLDYSTGPIAGAANSGHWVDLTLDGTPTAAGANDTIMINLNQVPFNALRMVYTAGTAGTGHCDIFLTAKQIGG